MRSILRPCGFVLVTAVVGLLPACGGGGGGGGGGSNGPATTPASSVTLNSEGTSEYELSLLGDLGEGSYAMAINNSGQVTGNYLVTDGAQHVFIWSDGEMRLLVEDATARSINDDGDVAGWLERDATTQAFVHTGQLELFDFPDGPSRAYGIDNNGRVTGRYTAEIEQAFLDDAGETTTLLPALAGYATAINDTGQILIKASGEGAIRAMLLESNGTLVDLGTLGGENSQAEDLNDSGDIVGWSQGADGRYRAFLWTAGAMIDLSEPDWSYSSALATNDSGQVLIKASTGTENRIYLWEDGQYTDLDHLGLEYAEVTDLNNQGQIVGWTTAQDGSFRAFLATPRS